jgi:hypothetical protein
VRKLAKNTLPGQAYALAGARTVRKLAHMSFHTHMHTHAQETRCAALCACLSHGSAMCRPAGRNQEHISSRMVVGKEVVVKSKRNGAVEVVSVE